MRANDDEGKGATFGVSRFGFDGFQHVHVIISMHIFNFVKPEWFALCKLNNEIVVFAFGDN